MRSNQGKGGVSIPEIQISVREKLPVVIGLLKHVVSDNADYTVRCTFDSDWGDGLKTYFFVLSNGTQLTPVTSNTDEIALPKLPAGLSGWLYIGVQQGSIVTTRPCGIPVYPAITALLTDDPIEPPDPDVYEQIIERINQLPSALAAAENAGNAATAAADSAANAASSANAASAAAQMAQEAVEQMSFVSFEIDGTGHLIIEKAERLATTSFTLTESGNLEVTI